uniref:Uncharacterized protein n=1 Tax=Oryzias sinensis TaxID=183150 RepID=A0A8C8DT49_9TELE
MTRGTPSLLTPGCDWNLRVDLDHQLKFLPEITTTSVRPDIILWSSAAKAVILADDGNIRKKEHEKLEKYQRLREELEKAWKVKVTVVTVVIGALGAVTPKLEEWLQQIPGKISDISIQKSAVLGTAKILRRTLKLPDLW